MSNISTELVNALAASQNPIWQQVSQTVSASGGAPLTFANPLTIAAQTADLYAELGSPMVVIQFAFAETPEGAQCLLIPQETALAIANDSKETPVTEIDENLVSDIRNILEAIVQGICLAVGSIKNEPVVAVGLTTRYQIFSFPPNMSRSQELVRTQIAITGGDVNGAVIWLIDEDTARDILGGGPAVAAREPEALNQLDITSHFDVHRDESQGLNLLMDIPMEITVELGRVRMLLKDVVELGTGSIVEIEKAAGEPVDVLVNGRPVARGEVVVIEDNFGVRITEILSPQDRLARLGEVA